MTRAAGSRPISETGRPSLRRAAGGAAVCAALALTGAPATAEAPQAGLAIWDGTPSLGGAWVAHAEAAEPRPVILRAPDGREARARLLPLRAPRGGREFLLSAETARALDLEPGEAVRLDVLPAEAGRHADGRDTSPEADDSAAVPEGEAAATSATADADATQATVVGPPTPAARPRRAPSPSGGDAPPAPRPVAPEVAVSRPVPAARPGAPSTSPRPPLRPAADGAALSSPFQNPARPA